MYSNRPLVNAAAAVTRRRQKPTLEGEKRLPSSILHSKNRRCCIIVPSAPRRERKGEILPCGGLKLCLFLVGEGSLFILRRFSEENKEGGLLGILRWGGSVGGSVTLKIGANLVDRAIETIGPTFLQKRNRAFIFPPGHFRSNFKEIPFCFLSGMQGRSRHAVNSYEMSHLFDQKKWKIHSPQNGKLFLV